MNGEDGGGAGGSGSGVVPGRPRSDERVRALAQRYSADAAAYKQLWAPELAPLNRALIADLPLAEARRITDIGAGVGAHLAALRQAAPAATIIAGDRARGMLALAPPRHPRVVLDAMHLPLRDEALDAAVMAFMLFHVPDPSRALAEVRRVLRAGGAIGLGTWGEQRPRAAIQAWEEELDAHGAAESEPMIAQHELMDTEETVHTLLTSARFVEVRVRTIRSEFPVTLEDFIAQRTTIGPCRSRLESLDERGRTACLERAIARIGGMDPREYVDDIDAILAVGRA